MAYGLPILAPGMGSPRARGRVLAEFFLILGRYAVNRHSFWPFDPRPQLFQGGSPLNPRYFELGDDLDISSRVTMGNSMGNAHRLTFRTKFPECAAFFGFPPSSQQLRREP